MNSRERVLAALEHREPDRVPVDLGGTIMTGITVLALSKYRRYLEKAGRLAAAGTVSKACELYQMLGEVEDDLVEQLALDVLPVEPEAIFFGIKRDNYKPWTLFDGTEVLVPGEFNVDVDQSGDWLLHEEGDPTRPLVARMPKGGYYFDMVKDQSLHLDYQPPALKEKEKEYQSPLAAQKLDFLAARAQKLRPTGKALLLGSWRDFGPPSVGSMPDWLCLLATEPEYVEALFAIKTEADLMRLEQLSEAVGDSVDIFGVDGADYGTQRSEMFNPELFKRFYLPYYTTINNWVHSNTGWKTWKHSCGSIPQIIPLLAESGLDAINPVQTSAAGMRPQKLKEEIGSRITFWGGGVDTQHTLPFATPEEVYAQVTERIEVLSPGGGFVFAAVHNVQAKTPPQNLEAMFEAIRDNGRYS